LFKDGSYKLPAGVIRRYILLTSGQRGGLQIHKNSGQDCKSLPTRYIDAVKYSQKHAGYLASGALEAFALKAGPTF